MIHSRGLWNLHASRNLRLYCLQIRRISHTSYNYSESDSKSTTASKRPYNKRVTNDQLTDVLKKAPKLMANPREIRLLGDDDDSAIVTKKPFQKVDKRYQKDLDKVVSVAEKKVKAENIEELTDIKAIEVEKSSKRRNGHRNSDQEPHTTKLKNRDSRFDNSKSNNTRDFILERLQKSDKSIFLKSVRPTISKSRAMRVMNRTKKYGDKIGRDKPNKDKLGKDRTRKLVKVDSELISVNEDELARAKEPDYEQIPMLSHELDRVLFSPGVHFLQDPRTRIYNFPPFLKKIIKYEDFNFEAVGAFQRVSKDSALLNMCKATDRQYYSSTSSMTSTLMQFYYLLNNFTTDSEKFASRFGSIPYTGLMTKLPASLIITPRGKNSQNKTIYSIESDKSYDTEILLLAMGHCLETLLTTEPEKFKEYNIDYDGDVENPQSVYNYSKYGKFLMRSQLDCFDSRLPRKTFDLKTRAVCSIRYDGANPDLERDLYQIWRLKGEYESFEREYNDLVRTGALMKYMFQARIGQMDGIFVAYHNINSFFGFQYLPLEELDNVYYNHETFESIKHTDPKLVDISPEEVDLSTLSEQLPTYIGETQFKMSLSIWDRLLETVTKQVGDDVAFRLILKAERRGSRTSLKVYAVPIDESEISALQDFPTQFQTSFREKLSNEDRLKNLIQHRDDLMKFNEETFAKKEVYAYTVVIDSHIIGGTPSTEEFPLPKRVGEDWKVQYLMLKYESDDGDINRSKLLNLLRLPTDAITAGFERSTRNNSSEPVEARERRKLTREEILKIYSKIGSARASKWSNKDSMNRVYEPLTRGKNSIKK